MIKSLSDAIYHFSMIAECDANTSDDDEECDEDEASEIFDRSFEQRMNHFLENNSHLVGGKDIITKNDI